MKPTEDKSIEDLGRELEAYFKSPAYWLQYRRWQFQRFLRRIVCAFRGHCPKEWGGTSWTDYGSGYEYDGGIRCNRCGEDLT